MRSLARAEIFGARIGGVGRQIARDRVLCLYAKGADGLVYGEELDAPLAFSTTTNGR